MKKVLRNSITFIFAFVLLFTTSTTAFAHSPTDPANSSSFTVVQSNRNDGWSRAFLFDFGLFLPNDGPIFLADAVNNWNWVLSRKGTVSIYANFQNEADYRLMVISPDGSQIYHDQTFRSATSLYANVFNLNPCSFRVLVFSNGEYFFLNDYYVIATYN